MRRNNLLGAALVTCGVMGMGALANAQSISVNVNGTTYQCSGGGSDQPLSYCKCDDDGDRLLLYYRTSGTNWDWRTIKSNISSIRECEQLLQNHPSCD